MSSRTKTEAIAAQEIQRLVQQQALARRLNLQRPVFSAAMVMLSLVWVGFGWWEGLSLILEILIVVPLALAMVVFLPYKAYRDGAAICGLFCALITAVVGVRVGAQGLFVSQHAIWYLIVGVAVLSAALLGFTIAVLLNETNRHLNALPPPPPPPDDFDDHDLNKWDEAS